jgi:protein-disulfide isomerase
MIKLNLVSIVVTGGMLLAQTPSGSLTVKSASEKATAPLTPGSQGISKELGEAILAELHQIRVLLERQQPSAPLAPVAETAKVSATGFSIGRADAPLTLVEFADYQCPFCRQFQTTVYEKLKKNYIDTGKLRFITRDLPLEFHSNASAAANASRCAGDQNQFWQMRETLIAHADKLESDAIAGYAQAISLNMDQFGTCVAQGKYLPSIRDDVAEATAAGIGGTPAFILGKTSATAIEGIRLTGAQPYEVFEQALIGQLAK